jgi:hypothetical protein
VLRFYLQNPDDSYLSHSGFQEKVHEEGRRWQGGRDPTLDEQNSNNSDEIVR